MRVSANKTMLTCVMYGLLILIRVIAKKVPSPVIFPNETEHIDSFKLRITESLKGSQIFYTTDGSKPTLNSLVAVSGRPITVNTIGPIFVKTFAVKDGLMDSDMVAKRYITLKACEPPSVFPNGGTYAGSIDVKLISDTSNAMMCYNLNQNIVPTTLDSICIENGKSFTLHSGQYTVKIVAVLEGFADSPVKIVNFNVLTKVDDPIIKPNADIYTISATLIFTCNTPNATIFFTTDGSIPTQASLSVQSQDMIVMEEAGDHVVKAFATENSMLPSDIVTKRLTVLKRLSIPSMEPPPGQYTGDTTVRFICNGLPEGAAGVDAKVYYTTDGIQTPTTASPSIVCGQNITLVAPGSLVIRAFSVCVGRSPSSIIQHIYELTRPPYDIYTANPSTFKVQPDVEILAVEKDLLSDHYGCAKRTQRGRLVVLRNPIGHFTIVPPLDGCTSGRLEQPSVSGRAYKPPPGINLTDMLSVQSTVKQGKESNSVTIDDGKVKGLSSSIRMALNGSNALKASSLRAWKEQYDEVSEYGCQVVTNAGFFDTTSHSCLGDIVSDKTTVQSSKSHNVNFGLKNGKFYVGYVPWEEKYAEVDANSTLDNQKFDFLLSGLGWLVRYGRSYVRESFSSDGDAESNGAQSTGDQFLSVHSARTALGVDGEGNLLILQVEGETWKRGMSLYEFSDLLVDLGFQSAINLDGGGSATMTVNHSLVSAPTWRCQDGNIPVAYNEAEDDPNLFRCEKRVSSITCVHAMAPPFISLLSPNPSSTYDGLSNVAEPSNSPTKMVLRHPSDMPVSAPSTSSTSSGQQDDVDSNEIIYNDDDDTSASIQTSDGVPCDSALYYASSYNETMMEQITELESSVDLFKSTTGALLVLMALSVLVHCCMCLRMRQLKRGYSDDEFDSRPGGQIEMIPDNHPHSVNGYHGQRSIRQDSDGQGRSMNPFSDFMHDSREGIEDGTDYSGNGHPSSSGPNPFSESDGHRTNGSGSGGSSANKGGYVPDWRERLSTMNIENEENFYHEDEYEERVDRDGYRNMSGKGGEASQYRVIESGDHNESDGSRRRNKTARSSSQRKDHSRHAQSSSDNSNNHNNKKNKKSSGISSGSRHSSGSGRNKSSSRSSSGILSSVWPATAPNGPVELIGSSTSKGASKGASGITQGPEYLPLDSYSSSDED